MGERLGSPSGSDITGVFVIPLASLLMVPGGLPWGSLCLGPRCGLGLWSQGYEGMVSPVPSQLLNQSLLARFLEIKMDGKQSPRQSLKCIALFQEGE